MQTALDMVRPSGLASNSLVAGRARPSSGQRNILAVERRLELDDLFSISFAFSLVLDRPGVVDAAGKRGNGHRTLLLRRGPANTTQNREDAKRRDHRMKLVSSSATTEVRTISMSLVRLPGKRIWIVVVWSVVLVT